MKTSGEGINLIKQFEGCRLTAYKCPAGVWTIGYGHTEDVRQGDTITQAQADGMLKRDLAKYENKVKKYDAKYRWNQNEFDALVSFAYNIGSIDQLTANGTRGRAVISEKILLYNKAGGKALAGLTRRRQAERALFLTPCKATGSGEAEDGIGQVSESCGQKSVLEIAKEVKTGKWGNGQERKKRLEAAGYNYSVVQAKVNELVR